MDIKKILLTGSAVAAMAFVAACSDDSSSGPKNEEPASSATIDQPGSSDATTPTSNGTVAGSSSSASEPVEHLSSSMDASVTNMVITEVMYNAPDASELEWVEVSIAAGPDLKSMAFYKLRLEGAITYSFPAEPLTKGEYIVVTNNVELFKETYPAFAGRLFGPWDNDPSTGTVAKLSNEGDVIDVKLTGNGDVSCSYSKEPPWPSLANGKGRTLVYKGGNAALPSSWGASKILKGNPGVGNDEWLTTSNVRINEIMPTLTGQNAWVELYNAGTENVDVTGWQFESKVRNETLTIKSGIAPAGSHLVLDGATDFSEELIVSPIGGAYYLYGATEGDESSLLLPSSELSSGVVDLADGSTAQGALTTATPGAINTNLYIGPVVINEIHYHPIDDNANDVEFLELKNTSEAPITLYQKLSNASRGWKVEGINMEFTSADILPANGFAVLFPESLSTAVGEAELRTRYSIASDVLIKFYKGKLSNRGEMVAVKKPFAFSEDPVNPMNNQWFYDWSDATLYSDGWKGTDFAKTDGFGYSLQRKDYTTMGYEASAWIAAEPTPGK
jgi:hypothetical protein